MVAPPSDDASREELRDLVLKLIELTEDQQHKIEELEPRLRKDSGNSSRLPSSDAPWSKRRPLRRPSTAKK